QRVVIAAAPRRRTTSRSASLVWRRSAQIADAAHVARIAVVEKALAPSACDRIDHGSAHAHVSAEPSELALDLGKLTVVYSGEERVRTRERSALDDHPADARGASGICGPLRRSQDR